MSTYDMDEARADEAFSRGYDSWVAAVEAYIIEEAPDSYLESDHPQEMMSVEDFSLWEQAFQERRAARRMNADHRSSDGYYRAAQMEAGR